MKTNIILYKNGPASVLVKRSSA